MSEQKNVFISHIHEDDEVLNDLKTLLSKKGYNIRDSSIDSSKPNKAKDKDYIKSEILAPRIQWAGVMIVLISSQTHDSEWVNWEIEYAQKIGKRIVGVWARDELETKVPDSLEKFADAVVGWQADRVIDAIEGRINNWYEPDGKEHSSRIIPRIKCQ